MAIRCKPPDQKSEAQELLRQEQSRAAPTLGAKRTSRAPGSGGGGGGGGGGRPVTLYLLNARQTEPVESQLGVPQGSKTEVRDGEIKEKDAVIIGMTSSASSQSQTGVVNPFQPSQPRPFGFR